MQSDQIKTKKPKSFRKISRQKVFKNELGLVDDTHAGVGSADGQAGREDVPDVRLGVVHLDGLQVAEK